MEFLNQTGFFPEYYLKIRDTFNEEQINNFTNLNTDEERINFINKNLKSLENYDYIKKDFSGKNKEQSLEIKEKANNAFKSKKWIEALLLYSKSYIAMPGDNHSDIAILLANRSAALYHMEKYDECLQDIFRSLKMDYPKDLLFKLYDRQARCHLAKKEYTLAMEGFKQTLTSLDYTKLSFEKRCKIERDSIVMIKMLEKEMQREKIKKKSKISSENKYYINESVVIDCNQEEGRFAKSKSTINVGDEILVEKPNVFALLEKFSKTHCQNCFGRTIVPIACPQCTDVVFCSDTCKDTALSSYHKYECGILQTIWRSGASINCHLALRLIANKTFDYFHNMKDNFNIELSLEKIKNLPIDDYRRVYNLVRHEDKRSGASFFQYTLMAYFLNACLKERGYFENLSTEENINFITSLILRNLQFLQFNTHEIYELHKTKSGNTIKTVFIGGGVYPTLALFNHSCDPGIIKYYQGTTVHVNAIKTIQSGQVIAENYGPLYSQEKFDDRQQKLKELYWFDCNCEACLNNWPRYEEMNTNIIRFRCDADEKCPNIIDVPANCNDFMVKCNLCDQFTNILKGLKVMQDTELMDKTAKRHYEAGDFSKALHKYIDMLKIMNEVLAPPFIDYCQCQQNIKDCFLHFGNIYILNE